MTWFTYPWTEVQWNMKSARVGYSASFKTGFLQFFTHWKPSAVGIYHPTGEDKDRYVKGEINTHYDDNVGAPCLKGMLSNSKSKTATGENTMDIKILRNGARIYNLNAGVPRDMRALTLDRIGIEEPSAYHSLSEGDAIRLILKRMATIPDPKAMAGGTPVFPNDYTHQGFLMGDQQYRYYPCPHCGHYQQLRWEQFVKEGDDAGKMQCESCNQLIANESLRWMDKRAGQACPLGLDRSKQVIKNGYPVWLSTHSWAAMGYDRGCSWTEIVGEYKYALAQLKEHANPDPMQTFVNTVLGRPWEDSISTKFTAEGLAKRQQDTATGNAYPPDGATWEAPNGVLIVTLGVDTQGGDDSEGQGLRVHVWGWGRGEECWHLAEFAIDGDPQHEATLNELDPLAAATWHREDGARLTMALGAIDEGGNATEAVRRWCAKRVGTWIPVKGQHQPTAALLGRGVAVNFTAKNKAANNVRKDVHFFGVGYERSVTLLGHRLRIEQPGPGYIHFGCATTTQTLAEMFPWKRLPSKKPRADGVRVYSWVKPAGARDEAGDCWRYANAALGVVRRRYGQEERFWSDHESKALATITGGTTSGRNLLAGMMFA